MLQRLSDARADSCASNCAGNRAGRLFVPGHGTNGPRRERSTQAHPPSFGLSFVRADTHPATQQPVTEPIKHETDPAPGEGEDEDENDGGEGEGEGESVAELYNRQHDHFGCEGPGLGSMLREMVERGRRLEMPGQVEVGTMGAENVLVAFRREAEAAVRRHRKERRGWFT